MIKLTEQQKTDLFRYGQTSAIEKAPNWDDQTEVYNRERVIEFMEESMTDPITEGHTDPDTLEKLHDEAIRIYCKGVRIGTLENMGRQALMDFYRSDRFNEVITVDDAREIFVGVLRGSSDIDQKLLHEVCDNYGVECPCCPKQNLQTNVANELRRLALTPNKNKYIARHAKGLLKALGY